MGIETATALKRHCGPKSGPAWARSARNCRPQSARVPAPRRHGLQPMGRRGRAARRRQAGQRAGDLSPRIRPATRSFHRKGLSGGGGPGALGSFLKDGYRNWKSSSWQDKYAKAYAPSPASPRRFRGCPNRSGPTAGFAVLPEYSTGIFDKVYENDLLNRTDTTPSSATT